MGREFGMVKVCAELELPTVMLPKSLLVGLKARAAGVRPVPESAAVWVWPVATPLSYVMVSVSDLAPELVGTKVTSTVQLPAALSVTFDPDVPQLLLESEN